ncbi:hypothetical protein ACFWB0_15295 [Rhodococcus sp. NPDC060086]
MNDQIGDAAAVDGEIPGADVELAASGTHEGLFYRPTVLADLTPEMPA